MKLYYTHSFGGGHEESRRLLEAAFCRYTGDAGKAASLIDAIKTGACGKPYIEGFCFFSVSHSNSAWAVIISDIECGLDIQFERNCDIISISRRWFDPADADRIACVNSLNTEAGENEFFRIWARREALVKAIGCAVYDTGLPAVNDDIINAGDKSYAVRDIEIPDFNKLHAAVCFCRETADNPDTGTDTDIEIEYEKI